MKITLSRRVNDIVAHSLTIRAIYKVDTQIKHYRVIAFLEHNEEFGQSDYMTDGEVSDTVSLRTKGELPLYPVLVKTEEALQLVCRDSKQFPCVYRRDKNKCDSPFKTDDDEIQFFKKKKKPLYHSESAPSNVCGTSRKKDS